MGCRFALFTVLTFSALPSLGARRIASKPHQVLAEVKGNGTMLGKYCNVGDSVYVKQKDGSMRRGKLDKVAKRVSVLLDDDDEPTWWLFKDVHRSKLTGGVGNPCVYKPPACDCSGVEPSIHTPQQDEFMCPDVPRLGKCSPPQSDGTCPQKNVWGGDMDIEPGCLWGQEALCYQAFSLGSPGQSGGSCSFLTCRKVSKAVCNLDLGNFVAWASSCVDEGFEMQTGWKVQESTVFLKKTDHEKMIESKCSLKHG